MPKNSFFLILSLKVAAGAFFILLEGSLGYKATDADFYHTIAQGVIIDSNVWGNFLKRLNQLGLYSRQNISLLIFMSSCIIVPWLFVKIITTYTKVIATADWYALITLLLYPTLLVFSTDIY